MRTNSKAARKFDLFRRLGEMGFTFEESQTLYRAQMTLHRWAEAECNGEIQRDEPEDGGKVWRVNRSVGPLKWEPYQIADREAGALRRVAAIVARHPAIWFYRQGDPRGCSLYVGKLADVPPHNFDIGPELPREKGSKWRVGQKGGDWYGMRFDTKQDAEAWANRENLSLCYASRGVAVCV